MNLTPRQHECLDFIKAFQAENEFSPSYREIMAGVGRKSCSEVHRLVTGLCERGAITRIPAHSRSIEIVDKQGWQPIETALRDGTKVDLWIAGWEYRYPVRSSKPIRGSRRCWRVPDCYFRKSWGGWLNDNGKGVTGLWYYDEAGDRCFRSDDTSEDAFVATHWMPRPKPPE